jgi:hypothetical protein
MVATSAMAASGVWIGGDASDPTGWKDAANWSGGQPYHYPDTVTINNLSTTSSMANDWANPNPGIISDSFTGGVNSLGSTFMITSPAGGISCAGASVAAGCTLDMNLSGGGDAYTSTNSAPNYWTFTVAPTAVLNLAQVKTTPQMFITGGGLVTLSQSNTMLNSVSITGGSTYTITDNNGYAFAGLTGDATSTLNIGAATFSSLNFSFLGQINYTGATSGRFGFDTSASAVVGANIQLGGTGNGAYALEAGYNSTNTTFTDCKFTGDGMINATNGAQAAGSIQYTMVSNGSTFAASPTNYAGTATHNGQLTLCGNLSLGKDGSGNNSQIVAAVMGNGSTNGGTFTLGTDYTKLAAPITNGSLGGAIICPDSATNVLADTNLVVNITPGLSPKGVNSLTLGVVGTDPFAGQSLAIVTAANTSFTTSSFAKVKIVGGSATVGYSGGNITLSNIFSNPTLAGDINNDGLVDVADYDIWAANVGATGASWLQGDLNGDGLVDVADYDIWAANVGQTSATPEPISMIILAIGGGLVALKRRNG